MTPPHGASKDFFLFEDFSSTRRSEDCSSPGFWLFAALQLDRMNATRFLISGSTAGFRANQSLMAIFISPSMRTAVLSQLRVSACPCHGSQYGESERDYVNMQTSKNPTGVRIAKKITRQPEDLGRGLCVDRLSMPEKEPTSGTILRDKERVSPPEVSYR